MDLSLVPEGRLGYRALLVATALAGALVLAGWFFWGRDVDEAVRITKKVEAHVVVPEESPVVTTVEDPDKLSDTPFAGVAKKGDKILFYTSAKKAILYDPKADRVIDIARLAEQPPK